jgi:hypothetical protein
VACWDAVAACCRMLEETRPRAANPEPYTEPQLVLDATEQEVAAAQGVVAPDDVARSERSLADDQRQCPSCAEIIKKEAMKCRFCGCLLDKRLQTPKEITPPSLDWKLVFTLAAVTLGIFWLVMAFWQSRWARKADAESKATIYYIVQFGCSFFAGVLSVSPDTAAFGGLLNLLGAVFFQSGNFSIKQSMEHYYTAVEPEGLRLSGPMTFFFSCIYFQYHFNRIAAEKKVRIAAS